KGALIPHFGKVGVRSFQTELLQRANEKLKIFLNIVRWYKNVNLSLWTNESNK
ncbi:hypothetical protein Q604_UNBC18331G0001, partial [human gut metagenome]